MIACLLLVFLVQASVTTAPGLLSHVPSFSAGFVGINIDGFSLSETMTAFNDNLLDTASRFLPLGEMPPVEVELPIVEEVEPLKQQSVQVEPTILPTILGQLFSTVFVTIPTVVRSAIHEFVADLDLAMSIPPDASEPLLPLLRMNSNDNKKKRNTTSELLRQSSPTKGDMPFVLYWTGCHGSNNNNSSSSNKGLSPYELSTTVEMVPPTGNQTDSATFITMKCSSARPIGDHGSKSVCVGLHRHH